VQPIDHPTRRRADTSVSSKTFPNWRQFATGRARAGISKELLTAYGIRTDIAQGENGKARLAPGHDA
jgi:hypothetical protein